MQSFPQSPRWKMQKGAVECHLSLVVNLLVESASLWKHRTAQELFIRGFINLVSVVMQLHTNLRSARATASISWSGEELRSGGNAFFD